MIETTGAFLRNIPWLDLGATLTLVAVALATMWYYRLSILFESVQAIGRAFLQLVFMAGLLLVVFRWNNLPLNVVLCLFMVGVAALTASRQSAQNGALAASFLSQALAALVTLTPMVLLGVIETDASFFLPVAAMIIRNNLDRASLAFERLDAEVRQNRELIEQYLALGFDPNHASRELVRRSVEASLIPTLNKLKVVGLVGLPGLMTGMILNATPGTFSQILAYAASLQAIILYVIFAGSLFASLTVCLIMRRSYFNEREQLVVHAESQPSGH